MDINLLWKTSGHDHAMDLKQYKDYGDGELPIGLSILSCQQKMEVVFLFVKIYIELLLVVLGLAEYPSASHPWLSLIHPWIDSTPKGEVELIDFENRESVE